MSPTTTINLYPFDLEKNRTQFQEFLVKGLPTTVSLLGWSVNTGFYDTDSVGKCQVWTSHSDPLMSNNNDIVVWIFDSLHRIRVFVSSEIILDLGEFTTDAIQLASTGVYPASMPTSFVNPELEALYIKSQNVFKNAISEYVYQHKKDVKDVLIHGVNSLWFPAINEIFNIQWVSTCFRFAKPVSEYDANKTYPLSEDYTMSVLEKSDVNLVQSTNKIAFELDYVQDCFKISSAIRRRDTNELTAWSMTHRDLFVGSLHVLPDYRRRGYAEIIMQDLCKRYVDHYNQRLPPHLAEKAYFGSAVETFNNPSAYLHKKLGFKPVGLGIAWIGAEKKA